MKEKIIEIENVSFHYGEKYVLNNINISIEKESFTAIVGPNGSGKSTLLKCILGVLHPQKGTIRLYGTEIEAFKAWNRIGYVSQKANSFNTEFPASVLEVVSMGLFRKKGLFRRLNKRDKEKVVETLRLVGMENLANKSIGELSGGQQQRVFIARALVSDPELLVLDEPTVGVDAKSVSAFYELLEHLHREKKMTLLLVTHDIGVVTDRLTNVVCLNQCVYFHGDVESFQHIQENDELTKLYGHSVQVLEHNH